MKIRGFISYTRSDERHAQRLSEKLRLLGVDVWQDRYQLSAGVDLTKTIATVIEKETDIVFVVVSAKALFAPWVKWENERAVNAAATGHHIKIVYIIVEMFSLPEEIKNHVYIDFTIPSHERTEFRLRKEITATEELAKYLLKIHPFNRLGIYDAYYSYADLDQRRELDEGVEGANIYQILRSAKHRIFALGFFFGHLFGMEGGTSIASWIHEHIYVETSKIELFVPDPNYAPLDNLRIIYPHGEQIPGRIQDFIETFSNWGKQMKLNEEESKIITLTLVKCCPNASIMAIDHNVAKGRMFVSFSPTGFSNTVNENIFHIELRYPQTPIYRHYYETIKFVQLPESQTKVIFTSHI